MEKFAEFMDKVMADEAAKAEFGAVFGARKERELSDDDFQKIVELSEKLGAAVTLDEVKDFFSGDGRELSEEELEGVAGGWVGEIIYTIKAFLCPLCREVICTTERYKLDRKINYDFAKMCMHERVVEHLLCKHSDILGNDRELAEKKAWEIYR